MTLAENGRADGGEERGEEEREEMGFVREEDGGLEIQLPVPLRKIRSAQEEGRSRLGFVPERGGCQWRSGKQDGRGKLSLVSRSSGRAEAHRQ